MSRPKDGEERRVEASLVYQFEAGDRSVGIQSGWVLIGLAVGDRMFELSSADDLDLHRYVHALEALPDTAPEFAEPERGEDC
jgi:hypothetical protein